MGWTNCETWVVALWLEIGMGAAAYWEERAKGCWRDAAVSQRVRSGLFTQKDQAVLQLVEQLRESVDKANPIREASLFADLLRAAISEIDWHEIAAHLLDDAIESPTEGKSDEGGERP